MVGGQCLDLQSDKLGQPARPDLAHIQHLQGMKTGALLRFACEAGAILAQTGNADRAALVRFGECLGLAFQISDDLLDAEGDEGVVGKRTGKDADAGKATLVGLLGVEQARERLLEVREEAEAAIAVFGERAEFLKEAALFVAMRSR